MQKEFLQIEIDEQAEIAKLRGAIFMARKKIDEIEEKGAFGSGELEGIIREVMPKLREHEAKFKHGRAGLETWDRMSLPRVEALVELYLIASEIIFLQIKHKLKLPEEKVAAGKAVLENLEEVEALGQRINHINTHYF